MAQYGPALLGRMGQAARGPLLQESGFAQLRHPN